MLPEYRDQRLGNRKEVFEKVTDIFRDVFDDDELVISDSTNSDDIEDWDSLEHIQLIVGMENFFGLLKQEIYYGVVYYSYEELKSEIERYIKYYNEQRIKEKLGWLSPVQYRLSLLAA